MERIPLKLKTLVVSVQKPWKARKLSELTIKAKYVLLQASPGNTGVALISDNQEGLLRMEGISFKSGHPPIVFDVDTDRLVGIDLSDMYFIGTCEGDKLIVSFLEEQHG